MSQTLQSFFNFAQQKLSAIYAEQEARSIVQLLLCNVLNIYKSDIYVNKEKMLSNAEIERLTLALNELEKSKPIQYVLGSTEFCGLPFAVNENVLIPRPETEELVEWILNICNNQTLRVLDVGTGSGCIAVVLKKKIPQAEVTAYDISEYALAVARENALKNGVNIAFERIDILAAQNLQVQKFDVVVSNPPYVCASEKEEMNNNVLCYEPHLALFVQDSEPLLFYNAIANFALLNLNKKGFLFFEVNKNFGQQIVEMLQQKGFVNVELRDDMNGNPRMIRAQHA
jgi:release factor glutamine methyltransferase